MYGKMAQEQHSKNRFEHPGEKWKINSAAHPAYS